MYAWYQRSVACYAYLSAVPQETGWKSEHADGNWVTEMPNLVSLVMKSQWWTRGWTLQELVAPSAVVFHIASPHGWMKIGTKISLLDLVAARTGIDVWILRGLDVQKCSVAQRMSWTSERETTRIEDIAYCLLGISGVNMPLLYGEGSKAFLRLQVNHGPRMLKENAADHVQEEIMKQSDDQTVFAWQLGYDHYQDDICGPLATHLSNF